MIVYVTNMNLKVTIMNRDNIIRKEEYLYAQCSSDISTTKNAESFGKQLTNQTISRRPLFGRGLVLRHRNGRGFRNRGR